MIRVRLETNSDRMGAKIPYVSAAAINIHKTIFSNVAARDLSSSPSKEGGPSHRRILISMTELQKVNNNNEEAYTTPSPVTQINFGLLSFAAQVVRSGASELPDQ
jgi:hypothetical protein